MEGVKRSDAKGHVSEQPLLGAAAAAVSQGGDHLVLLRRHVQALVAVHVQQGQSLGGEKEKQRQLVRVLTHADAHSCLKYLQPANMG